MTQLDDPGQQCAVRGRNNMTAIGLGNMVFLESVSNYVQYVYFPHFTALCDPLTGYVMPENQSNVLN